MTTTTTSGPTSTGQHADVAGAPPKLRRRPAYALAGAALIATGGLFAAWLATAADDSISVVVASESLFRGQTLTADDLTTANISGLQPNALTPAADSSLLLGQTLTSDIPRGMPIPPDAVVADALPAAGETVVGIQLSPGQLPSIEMQPGAQVRLIATPRTQDDPPNHTPSQITATLVSTSVDEITGNTVANVAVAAADAPDLAALAGTGRIALILDSDQDR